jgi:hypothetical protein
VHKSLASLSSLPPLPLSLSLSFAPLFCRFRAGDHSGRAGPREGEYTTIDAFARRSRVPASREGHGWNVLCLSPLLSLSLPSSTLKNAPSHSLPGARTGADIAGANHITCLRAPASAFGALSREWRGLERARSSLKWSSLRLIGFRALGQALGERRAFERRCMVVKCDWCGSGELWDGRVSLVI